MCEGSRPSVLNWMLAAMAVVLMWTVLSWSDYRQETEAGRELSKIYYTRVYNEYLKLVTDHFRRTGALPGDRFIVDSELCPPQELFRMLGIRVTRRGEDGALHIVKDVEAPALIPITEGVE